MPTAAASWIAERTRLRPRLGIVLGSGFGAAAELVEAEVSWSFAELPGFISPGVPGHAGRLIVGRLAGVPVVLSAGRLHAYEGHSLSTVTFPIRVLAALGIEAVLLTNAAGSIHPDLAPGDFVIVTDHLNLLGENPLRGPGGPERFVDLTEVYAPDLRAFLRRAASDAGISPKEGVYAAVSGPSYETPAEVRALAALGADLVGMSTVPEAIVARQCGLRVAALSCVTNRAAGLGGRISHDEVLAVGRATAGPAQRLLARFVQLSNAAESADSADSAEA